MGLLGVGAGLQDKRNQGGGLRADLLCPAGEAPRRPLQIVAVIGGHVGLFGRVVARLIAAGMAGNAPVFFGVVNIYRVCRGPKEHFLAGVAVRDTVVVLVEGDMVVDVHAHRFDFPVDEILCRERLQGAALHLLETFPPGMAALGHGAVVEPGQPLADGLVELRQAEKTLMAQGGQHPAFHLQDGVLHQGLVFRFAHPRRERRHPVVGGHLLVGGVEVRFIEIWRAPPPI